MSAPHYELTSDRQQFELVVRHRGVSFPLLITTKKDADRVLLLYNGAVDLQKKSSPIYQRATWVNEFDAHVINIDDPSVRLRPDVAIAWGQGTLDHYYSESVHAITNVITSSLGVSDPNRHVHFGSSAGGYQAFAAAVMDQGSTAVINNPQIDWLQHFMPTHVGRLLEVSFNGLSEDELRSSHSSRHDVTRFAELAGNFPNTHYWVNVAFESDILVQYRAFCEGAARCANLIENRLIETVFYSNPSQGHNPLFKHETVERLSKILTQI